MKEWMFDGMIFLLIFIIMLLLSGFRSRFIQKKIGPKTQLIISSATYLILIPFFVIDTLNPHIKTASLIEFAIILIIYPIVAFKSYKRLYKDKKPLIKSRRKARIYEIN